jgi:hypothetical protein
LLTQHAPRTTSGGGKEFPYSILAIFDKEDVYETEMETMDGGAYGRPHGC